MRKIRVLLILLLAVFLTGCATRIKYGVGKKLFHPQQKLTYKILMDEFQDLRTEEERDGTFSTTKGYWYTQDKKFKKNIGLQVSKAITKHMEKIELCEAVELRNIDSFGMTDIETMQSYADEGFDIVIFGDLYHFYGYQSGKTSALTAQVFGVVGVVAEMLANRKVIGGRAALGDIKIIDVKNKQLLFEGDFEYDYEGKETLYDGAQAYAIRALKEVNNQFMEKTHEVLSEK